MITITVKVFHRHYKGDNSYHIERLDIRADCLGWWIKNSGNGDFVLLHY